MIKNIKELLSSGNNIEQVAEKLNMDYNAVRYQMRKHDIASTAKRRYIGSDFLCECGESNPSNFYGDRKSSCKSCHNKKTHANQKSNKQWAVDYKGGKCEECGYDKSLNALQFHHKVYTEKDVNYSTMSSWGKDKMTVELDKCQLLCANCHAEKHEHIGYKDF